MASQQERIRRCLSALLVRLPFYGALAVRLEHRILFANEAKLACVETAATDGKQVFYRAGFIRSISDEALLFLIAHETLHAAFSHPLRGEGKDRPDIWNIASDDTVNRYLKPNFAKLPTFAIILDPANLGIAEAEWEALSTEAKYFLLLKHIAGNLSHRQDFCCLPTKPDTPTPEQWREWIKQSVDFAERVSGYGTVPSWVDEWITPEEKSKVPWGKVLKQFIQTYVISHWNYPPSRRYQTYAMLPKPQRERYCTLGIAIDTSGSITSQQLRQFWREVLAIRSAYPKLKVRLITCDAEVTTDELFPPNKMLPSDTELIGRGGTDFCPAFENFRHPPVPEAVVYLTDGLGSYPKAPPPYPVLWVLTGSKVSSQLIPFGTVIVMEPNDHS